MKTSFGTPIIQQGRRQLIGHGSAYPGPAVSTSALCDLLQPHIEIDAQKYAKIIASRLQVETRHLCRNFSTSFEAPRAGARNPELAAQAVRSALERAGVGVDQLGYLISHTATPAQPLPAGSGEIARLLGFHGPHMELRQACTGFANALQIAFAMTANPAAGPIAIVGVETGSVFFSPEVLARDSSQWINFFQMGDGAAAVVIAPEHWVGRDNRQTEQHASARISHAYFGQCTGIDAPGLCLPYGGSDQVNVPTNGNFFSHDFKSVAQHGSILFEAGRALLAQYGWEIHDVDTLIPHQASGAVAGWLANQWEIDPDRICAHAKAVGNLGSASIWAAVDDHLNRRNEVSSAERVALVFGAEATQYSYGGFVLED